MRGRAEEVRLRVARERHELMARRVPYFSAFIVILKKSAGNFPTHPNAAIKVKVKFKQLIGTLAKVQAGHILIFGGHTICLFKMEHVM